MPAALRYLLDFVPGLFQLALLLAYLAAASPALLAESHYALAVAGTTRRTVSSPS